MRGRKPKPKSQKLLDGSARKDPQRVNWDEPEATKGIPDMPPTLDAVGKEAWIELTSVLSDMNVLTLADKAAMEFYCITYSQYRHAVDSVTQYGQVLVSKRSDGTPTVSRNPYSVEMHKLRDACTKMLSEFGLTPASRARLKATPKDTEEDPLLIMLKERAGNN